MDKYKTSQLGQALKSVYRGKMSVGDSVRLAEREINEIFLKKTDESFAKNSDTGFFGDVVAKCPLCGNDVKRFKKSYSCAGYKEGCHFTVWLSMCSRTISIAHLRELVENGKTEVISGFVSPKSGKSFDAALKLENGRAVFDFERRANTRPVVELPVGDGDQPPLPEPPPGY